LKNLNRNKMKNKLYAIVLGSGLILSGACKRDLLNPVPQTSVSDITAFDSPERVANQVRSLYTALKGGKFYGGRYVVYNDVRGEDFVNATSNNITAADVSNFSVPGTSASIVDTWARAYSTINQCNLFLEGMAEKGTSVVGGDLAKNYIGEAKFIRALSYYSLLQLFAKPYWDGNGSQPGLPLRLTGIKGPGFSDLERSNVETVYQQVLTDLNDAETDLPLTYPTGATQAYTNTTRAHRNTAIALKTRVYLSMRNYDAVVTEANKIVPATAPFVAPSGVTHELQADVTNVFKAPYTTSESILSMPFTNDSRDVAGTQNQLGTYFYNNSSVGSAEFTLAPDGIIADPTWTETDQRRTFIYTNTTTDKKYLAKYTQPSPYLDFVPVLRYAEVLLNLAEAKARTTNSVDAQAIALLNAVRGRSDASTVFSAGDFATATDLINAILKERRIELIGEGIRNIDIMRLGLNLPARPGKAETKPGDAGYIMPISNEELIFNTLMTDN
jgi:hypothetical protein